MNLPTIPGRSSLFFAAGLTVIAVFSLVASPPVSAAQIPLQRVQVGDLDLATPQGKRQLDKRIDAAIHAVCVAPNRELPRSRRVVEGIDSCRAAASASVRHQLADLGLRAEVRAARIR